MHTTYWFIAGILTGATATAVGMLSWRGTVAVRAPVMVSERHDATMSAGTPTKASSMEDATARLAARLEREGGSDDDWELLAKSYEFLGRGTEAERARAHLATPAQATITAADAVRLADSLETPAGAGAAVAVQISGTVSIESRLAGRVDTGATLFIYAKAADSPGPPLAVERVTPRSWPVEFRLDDSMAMLPSRRLSQFQKVVVEARLSRTGQALPAAGDLYVTSTVLSPAAGKKLALVINHEIG